MPLEVHSSLMSLPVYSPPPSEWKRLGYFPLRLKILGRNLAENLSKKSDFKRRKYTKVYLVKISMMRAK
jgi:hypothetical protein